MTTQNKSILLVMLVVLPFYLTAQIMHGGTPYALKTKLAQPQFISIDNSELYSIDSSYNKDCTALEFARFLETGSELGDSFWTIDHLDNGDKLYRLGISSKGAVSIALYFKDVFIPKGAEIFVYDPEIKEFYGSYTFENNQHHGYFNTEMISGERIVVEYYEPKSVKGLGEMKLFEVLHAYKYPFGNIEKDFGDSGDCEVNVNCSEGNGKSNQRDAVLRLLIKSGNSGFWCSGSLINNTRQDRIPYLLTADHCGKSSSDDDMLQWRFYFRYQSPNCLTPDEEPQRITMIGCELVAASKNAGTLGSDFFLVKLINEIPEQYNPYFLGWNREGTVSNQGYTIHHPQGDIKKISSYQDPLSSATYSDGITNGYWEVFWSETTHGHGVTEGGSSGSPIFDDNGFLIGTLTGGQASCSALNAPDYYGKFSIHWETNGTNADEQLAPWLDPDNTGQLKLSGIYLDTKELEFENANVFSLVPNPANEMVEILLHDNMNNIQVDLFAINGQRIHTYYFSNSSRINISNLPKGVYLIRLTSESQSFVKKLIKE
jgi:hypothetical protein